MALKLNTTAKLSSRGVELATTSPDFNLKYNAVIGTRDLGIVDADASIGRDVMRILEMYGGGGGGGGSVYSPSGRPNGGDGGDVILNYYGYSFIARGGKGGLGGVWGNGSSFDNGYGGLGGEYIVKEGPKQHPIHIKFIEAVNGNVTSDPNNHWNNRNGAPAITGAPTIVGNPPSYTINNGGSGSAGIGDDGHAYGGGGGSGAKVVIRINGILNATAWHKITLGTHGLPNENGNAVKGGNACYVYRNFNF